MKEVPLTENKPLVKATSSALTQKQDFFYPAIISKNLNWVMVLATLFIYGALCAYWGSNRLSKKDISYEHKVLLTQAQETLDNLKEKLNQQYYYNTNSNHQFEKLENSITQTLAQTQGDYERKLKLKLKDEEIYQLKQNIKELNLILSQNMDKNTPREEALNYSLENEKILEFEHRQKLQRLKQAHDARKDAYLKILDLTKTEDQANWVQFQDNLDKEYYALKVKQDELRKKFYREKYIVLK